MYSILIQNPTTMESFQRFHPLFVDALNNGQLGVCQWFETGKSIETAVPELYDMIADKPEWRAIIVRFADEAPMSVHETRPDNPYDFLENREDDPRVRESDIPLVRLTHMLGGLPSPSVHFEAEVVREYNKAPRMVYRPSVSEEEQEAYRLLSQKYRLDGPPPSEIILVSLREHQELRVENVSKVWTHQVETNSSTFWRRNGYPSICRFTFCEMQHQGPVQHTADLFSAWMSVLLLALNDIDPSTLQAYKLHQIGVEFDRKAMKTAVQNTAEKLLSARNFLQKSIQRELEQKISEKTLLPAFRLETPVVLDLPLNKDFLAKPDAFGLASRTEASDKEAWKEMDEHAEELLDGAEVLAERALDRTAGHMRGYVTFSPEEIQPLDEYQREDLDKELSALNGSIYAQRAELPMSHSEERERMREQAAGVRDKLAGRLTRRRAADILFAVLALFLLSAVSGFVFCYTRDYGSWDAALIGALAGAAVLALGFLLQLLALRQRLRRNIDGYNAAANAAMQNISADSGRYSDYLGSIASFMHGQSYLTGLRHKVFLRNEAQFYKRSHIAALNTFLADLQEWSAAFHLPVSVEEADMNAYLEVDTDIAPYVNPLYTFDPVGSFAVMVNSTGNTINAPFDFVQLLRIDREELYDDAG